MPTLLTPFRGVRYEMSFLPDLGEVMTPPYDVIDETERAAYMARSPYSMIHLILGAEYPGDTVHNNRFTRAAALLQEWRHQHVLVPEPSLPMTLAILCRMSRRLPAPRPSCCSCGRHARPI
jgi:uncharacterized protein (DUF1015 family)